MIISLAVFGSFLLVLLGAMVLSNLATDSNKSEAGEDCALNVNSERLSCLGEKYVENEKAIEESSAAVQESLEGMNFVLSGKSDGSICRDVSEVAENVGQNTCVVYYVGDIKWTDTGLVFINESSGYGSRFVAPVFNGSIDKEYAVQTYLNKLIVVSGAITSYENIPQIIVENKNQITSPRVVSCDSKLSTSPVLDCLYSR